MAVILKKGEKIQTTCDSLQPGFTFDEFLEAFTSLYPKNWEKLGKGYKEHQLKTKPGKTTQCQIRSST